MAIEPACLNKPAVFLFCAHPKTKQQPYDFLRFVRETAKIHESATAKSPNCLISLTG
jgi:hypothetical protein